MRFLTKIGRFAFLRPPLGDLGSTYDDHLRLIGKRVVEFLNLALIELFSLVLRLRSYARLLVENRRFRSNEGRLTQHFTQKGSPPTNHSSSQKNQAKCSFVWYKNLDRSFFRFVTTHACDGQTDRRTDRQTDGQTEFSSQYRVCITCSAVKTSRVTLYTPPRVEAGWGQGVKNSYRIVMKFCIGVESPISSSMPNLVTIGLEVWGQRGVKFPTFLLISIDFRCCP